MRFYAKILSVLLFCSFLKNAEAQEYYIPLNTLKSGKPLITTSMDGLTMHYSLNAILGKDIQNSQGLQFTDIYFGKGYSSADIGNPKLPVFKKLIQVPQGAEVLVNVLSYSEQTINLADYGIENPIYPQQPSVRKDKNPHDEPFYFNSHSYASNAYDGKPIAKVEVLGSLRGMRIARVEIAPISYNPVGQTLKVFNDIAIDIIFEGHNPALQQETNLKTHSAYFEPIYSLIGNYLPNSQYDNGLPPIQPVYEKMLVVSHRMFEQTLQPFIQWKTRKGFDVEIVYTDEIGTSREEITEYIHDSYNNATVHNPAPTFLVLVGDIEQVPSSGVGSRSRKHTDIYYASVDGDFFPEMFYGRLSAQTPQQLQNIIDKIIYYEQYQFEDPSYLNDATFIAGADGTWNPRVGKPTVKYATQNFFNAAKGFNTIWAYGVGEDPNNPNSNAGYSGSYAPQRISVGFVNYTAHCVQQQWENPVLNINAVNSFTNSNRFPFVMGNCCLSADFGFSESIGEAWIRAKDKGAVTYIGSSPNSYWFEDFYFAVGAFPLQGNNNGYVPSIDETTVGAYESFFSNDYFSASGYVFAGNLSVTEANIQNFPQHSSPEYYWQAYNVLGDPSLTPFFTEGEDNQVEHPSVIFLGQSMVTVSALPGSYVALSHNSRLLGAGKVGSSGEANIEIEHLEEEVGVDLVVTRPQTKPFQTVIQAIPSNSPYIVLHAFELNDENGNNNGEADYGENLKVSITLMNVGSIASDELSVKLVSNDQFVDVLTNDAVCFGAIEVDFPNNLVSQEDVFTIAIANDAPNQHKAKLALEITEGENTWTPQLSFFINAPNLQLGELSIDDSLHGNDDGTLDPGEEGKIVIEVFNNGNSSIENVNLSISTTSDKLQLINNLYSIPSLDANEKKEVEFQISSQQETPLGTVAEVKASVQGGLYEQEKEYSVIFGSIPKYCDSKATSSGWSDLLGFTFGPLENTTPPGGQYDDFTQVPELVHEFVLGATYPVSVTLGDANQSTYTKGAKVFIDWNYDGEFADPEEVVFEVIPQKENWTAHGTITIPDNIPLGHRFVRVVVQETSSIDNITPCGLYSWGGTEDYRIILINPSKPQVDFVPHETDIIEGGVVHFTDRTRFLPTQWEWIITPGIEGEHWTFHNGTSQESQNPSLLFLKEGLYSVELIAANNQGDNTLLKGDLISVEAQTQLPIADFSWSNNSVLIGQVVKLTDLSQYNPIGWSWEISPGDESSHWEFVSGTNHLSQHPEISFLTPGEYHISLTVQNVLGSSEPKTETEAISVQKAFIMHSGTIYTSDGYFYDSGGPDNDYENDEDYTLTVFPKGEYEKLTVTFHTLTLEANRDFLEVYDGTTIQDPLLVNLTGTNSYLILKATNQQGALTFRFLSDGTQTRSGWRATFGSNTHSSVSEQVGFFAQIYPNPFQWELIILQASSIHLVEVYNLLGQQVLSYKGTGEEIISLNVEKLVSGVYYIKLLNEDGDFQLIKAVKQ